MKALTLTVLCRGNPLRRGHPAGALQFVFFRILGKHILPHANAEWQPAACGEATLPVLETTSTRPLCGSLLVHGNPGGFVNISEFWQTQVLPHAKAPAVGQYVNA